MRGLGTPARIERWARALSTAVAVALVAYLAVVAVRGGPPAWMGDFGKPGSEWTIGVVLAALTTACILSYRARGTHRPGASIAVVAALAATVVVLGRASFWRCHGEDRPRFFYPLIWTIALFTGDTSTPDACFTVTPVALTVARLAAFATLFLGAVLVAGALLQSRLDRLRVALSRAPVTVVVELDDDAQSMVCANLAAKSTGSLVLITDQPERPCVAEARNHGARIVTVDFNRPETLTSLSVWRRLERLYLLSPDAWANEVRLELISTRTDVPKDQRLQLIVRIDDPWQAEAWRAQLFGRADAQWAADAVGRYEATAHRLLDDIVARPGIKRVIVCGTSQLTLALCAELAQRQAERDFYTAPGQRPLPRLTTVAPDAAEYHRDHEHRLEQLGLTLALGLFDAVAATPSVAVLSGLIGDGSTADPAGVAVIFVDPDAIAGAAFDSTTATRLAARYRTTPIFAWEAEARVAGQRQTTIGQLRTYRLALHLPDDQAPDRWERAAMLIHARYIAGATDQTPATRPWSELDSFYKESNRLLVKNMLRIVEEVAEHTWNTWNGPAPEPVSIPHDAEPLAQLALMGFDEDAAIAMARAEHERWRTYYEKHNWRHGKRSDPLKRHPSLQDWDAIQADPVLFDKALTTVAVTLLSLRELGYRSRPVWERFERAGTVVAKRRNEPWSWTTETGAQMTAAAGDWEVRDTAGGDSWSVRDTIFRSTYQRCANAETENSAGEFAKSPREMPFRQGADDGGPDRYRRIGAVLARRAMPGERIETLEGPASATSGHWIVKGEQGEQWPVPAEQFARRYRRNETASASVDSRVRR